MPEFLYDWHLWWLDFWDQHPALFAPACVVAVAVAVAGRIRNMRRLRLRLAYWGALFHWHFRDPYDVCANRRLARRIDDMWEELNGLL